MNFDQNFTAFVYINYLQFITYNFRQFSIYPTCLRVLVAGFLAFYVSITVYLWTIVHYENQLGIILFLLRDVACMLHSICYSKKYMKFIVKLNNFRTGVHLKSSVFTQVLVAVCYASTWPLIVCSFYPELNFTILIISYGPIKHFAQFVDFVLLLILLRLIFMSLEEDILQVGDMIADGRDGADSTASQDLARAKLETIVKSYVEQLIPFLENYEELFLFTITFNHVCSYTYVLATIYTLLFNSSKESMDLEVSRIFNIISVTNYCMLSAQLGVAQHAAHACRRVVPAAARLHVLATDDKLRRMVKSFLELLEGFPPRLLLSPDSNVISSMSMLANSIISILQILGVI